MYQNYDSIFICIIVGDERCGKTELIYRFTQELFQEQTKMTIGITYTNKVVKVGGFEVRLQIWDVDGEERFAFLRPTYYKGANGAVVIFDLKSQESFNHVENWVNEVKVNTGDIQMILVGNGADQKRMVQSDEAELLAKKHSMLYLEESEENNGNNIDFFQVLAALMIGIDLPPEIRGREVNVAQIAHIVKIQRKLYRIGDFKELKPVKFHFANIELNLNMYDKNGQFLPDYTDDIIKEIYQSIKKALRSNSNFVIFPEYCFPANFVDTLKNIAKEEHIFIIGGCERRDNEKLSITRSNNAAIIFTPIGNNYIQKKFTRGKNEPLVTPGNNICIFHSEFGTFSVLICSDFLQDCLLLYLQGQIDFLIVPSYNKDINSFTKQAESKCLSNYCHIFIENIRKFGVYLSFAPMRSSVGERQLKKSKFFDFTEFSQVRKYGKISKIYKSPLNQYRFIH